ncbi:MAG: class I SAM-dependent methyltransferase [Candidatus Absconditabacterales bacterium]|jgi:ubiquinone/menaquinone biosynthesis C-methylase UbiE
MKNQELFDKYSRDKHWENHPTIHADMFAKFLKNNLNKQILSSEFVITDLGCGIGRDVVRFREHRISCMGFDIDHEALVYISNHYNIHGTNFNCCNIEKLPFQNSSKYAYFCINVMHYVNASKVMKEMYRTLKRGGYAFIHFNLLIIDENYSIDYHQKKSDVYELIKEFEIVSENIFLREDSKPVPHTHHIMQLILKKH